MPNQKDRFNHQKYIMKKLFLTLALGIATVSFAQQAGMEKPGKMDPEQKKAEMLKRQQEHLAKMTKDLNLSQDQVSKIKTLQDKEMADMKANMQKNKEERKDRMAEMKKKEEAHNAELRKILTPEQYEKWEANKKAKMEKRKEMMKDKDGKGEHEKRKMKKKSEETPDTE